MFLYSRSVVILFVFLTIKMFLKLTENIRNELSIKFCIGIRTLGPLGCKISSKSGMGQILYYFSLVFLGLIYKLRHRKKSGYFFKSTCHKIVGFSEEEDDEETSRKTESLFWLSFTIFTQTPNWKKISRCWEQGLNPVFDVEFDSRIRFIRIFF